MAARQTVFSTLAVLFTMALSFCSLSAAWAEGGDLGETNAYVHGVIRVVRSSPGHRSTSGHIGLTFHQPVNTSTSADIKDHYDLEVNPFNNKPSAYLGGTSYNTSGAAAGTEGGLQYETGVVGGYVIGFTPFITYNHNGTNDYGDGPFLWSGNPASPITNWRCGSWTGPDGTVAVDMGFEIEPGKGQKLYISELPGDHTFYWEKGRTGYDAWMTPDATHLVVPWDSRVYNSSDQTSASVKHEVAQTRGSVAKDFNGKSLDFGLDGSQVSGAWTDCRLGVAITGGALTGGTSWDSSAADTDQRFTGYDAPPNGTGARAWDHINLAGTTTGFSHTIVEFTGLSVDNIQARQDIGDPNRYTNETTFINLGTVTQPQGQVMEWEK